MENGNRIRGVSYNGDGIVCAVYKGLFNTIVNNIGLARD